jgi:hypothetical protein
MGGMQMPPQMSAGAGQQGFAGALGQDPNIHPTTQIDPALIQLLLMQMQDGGLEGGMQPETQAMMPLDPMAGMQGIYSQDPNAGGTGMAGMMGGMGGGMGMMQGMGNSPGGNLPPAFAQAQQMSQQSPQSATPY